MFTHRLSLWILLIAAACLRLLLAARVTGFIAVDDAYIHLRYGRQFLETGTLVYNSGEAVFGLTSPLYGWVAAAAVALAGEAAAGLLISINVVLWTVAVAIALQSCQPRLRLWLGALGSLAPVFVDNQFLGMETSLFVLLLVLAVHGTLHDRLTLACGALGLALVTRPEAVLLAPWLLWSHCSSHGVKAGLRSLIRPARAAILFGPGLAWVMASLAYFGHVLPQSMAAKTGWNNDHYAGLTSLRAAFEAVPRLTFLPFLDHLPVVMHLPIGLAVLGLAAAALWLAFRSADRSARVWMGFYAATLLFYLIGRGAIEASWYAVPPSLALAFGAGPLLARLPKRLTGSVAAWMMALVLAGASSFAAVKRAPLLASYEQAYGQAANMINVRSATDARVLVGEIGVFGWRSQHHVIDVGALVSPEVLPLKNEGVSLTQLARDLNATHIVVSTRAMETNQYPTVGPVFDGSSDRAWFEQHCRLLGRASNLLVFEVLPA